MKRLVAILVAVLLVINCFAISAFTEDEVVDAVEVFDEVEEVAEIVEEEIEEAAEEVTEAVEEPEEEETDAGLEEEAQAATEYYAILSSGTVIYKDVECTTAVGTLDSWAGVYVNEADGVYAVRYAVDSVEAVGYVADAPRVDSKVETWLSRAEEDEDTIVAEDGIYLMNVYFVDEAVENEGEVVEDVEENADVPTLTAKLNDDKTIELTWTSLSGYTKYQLMRELEDGTNEFVKVTSALKFTTEAKEEGTYTYKVRAMKTVDGKNVYSSYSAVVTVEIKAKNVPVLTAVVNSNATIAIEWTALSGYTKYQLREVLADGSYNTVKVTSGLKYTTEVKEKGTYTYVVRASYTNSSGKTVYSDYSDPLVVKHNGPRPKMSGEVYRNASICLKWTTVEGYPKYQVREVLSDGTLNTIKVTSTAKFTTEVKAKGTYTYVVRAYYTNESGKNIYTDYSDPFTIDVVGPRTKVTATVNRNATIALKWTALEGYTKYHVCEVLEDGSKSVIKVTSALKFTTEEKENGEYTYVVRAYYTNANGKNVYSDYSDPIVVKVERALFTINGVQYEQIQVGGTEVQIKSYQGTASSVVVPQTVSYSGKSYTVTKVGDSAFEGKTSLVSIDLPDTITIIGKRAFKGCTKLSEMK